MSEKEEKKENLENELHEYPENLHSEMMTSSARDCTGLIPSGIESESELESYEQLYPSLFPPYPALPSGKER